jgi:hypothetical protein
MGRKLLSVALLAFAGVSVACADWIDFEAQGANAPNIFNGKTGSPLVIGTATFTGGQLLRNELNSVDQTAVYATTNGLPGAYTNPLRIVFSEPINTFNVLIANNLADTYKVTDNLGGSQSFFLTANDRRTFRLPDLGIASVTIASATSAAWDFAIDDVNAPEPSLCIPVAGVLAFGYLFRRRKTGKYLFD